MGHQKPPLWYFQLNRLVKGIGITVCSITVLFLSGCNGLQLQQKGDASVETIENARSAIKDQEPQYKWMNASVKLSAKTPSRNLSGQGHLKIKKDSLLWLTVSPALGIEVMRLQITQDSFQVLDRVNNRYRDFSFNRVNQMFNPLKRSFQFKNLNNIFTGQPVFLPGERFELKKADTSGVVMMDESKVYKEQLNLFPDLLKTHKYTLEKPATGQFLKLTYPAYQAVGQYQLPKVIKIKTKNPRPLTLKIRLKSISFEKKDKVSFSVPESYE